MMLKPSATKNEMHELATEAAVTYALRKPIRVYPAGVTYAKLQRRSTLLKNRPAAKV